MVPSSDQKGRAEPWQCCETTLPPAGRRRGRGSTSIDLADTHVDTRRAGEECVLNAVVAANVTRQCESQDEISNRQHAREVERSILAVGRSVHPLRDRMADLIGPDMGAAPVLGGH